MTFIMKIIHKQCGLDNANCHNWASIFEQVYDFPALWNPSRGMVGRWQAHTNALIIQANWIRIRIRMDYALSRYGKCSSRSQIPADVMSSHLNYSESRRAGTPVHRSSMYGQSNYSHDCPNPYPYAYPYAYAYSRQSEPSQGNLLNRCQRNFVDILMSQRTDWIRFDSLMASLWQFVPQ